MVTYFNKKDMVSFGSYLLSEKRKSMIENSYLEDTKGIENPLPLEDRLNMVTHADVENWMLKQKSK